MHHSEVVLAPKDAGFPQSGPSSHQQIDPGNGEDDGDGGWRGQGRKVRTVAGECRLWSEASRGGFSGLIGWPGVS